MADKINQLVRHATLRQLQVFETIARLNSFSRAAEELHLTQPTVSMQVKKLADALETPLFEQIGRQVFLTQAGEVLYEAAQEVLQHLHSAEQRIKNLKGFAGGRIKLAVISSAQYFVPKVIHDFVGVYPDVSVAMMVGNKEQLVERILKNEDDFYILGQPPEGLNVESFQLAPNPLVFVAHKNHPLAQARKINLEQMQEVPLLMREKGSGMRAQIEAVFAKHHYTPNIKMILGGNEVVRLGLLQNLGVTVAAVATLLDEIEREEIVVLDVEGFPIHRQWYLVFPKGKSLSMAAQKLIELLRQEALALTLKLQSRLLSELKQPD